MLDPLLLPRIQFFWGTANVLSLISDDEGTMAFSLGASFLGMRLFESVQLGVPR